MNKSKTAAPSRWYYSEEDLKSLEYLDLPSPLRGRLHEIILEDPISQLNFPQPIVLGIGDSVAKAVRLMRKFRYGSVLILDRGRLAGIFTEKDLLVKTSAGDLDLERTPLGEVMTADPQSLDDENDSLAEVLHLMSVGGYRHIPIVRDGEPVGFVSIRGILRYLAENALPQG